MSNLFSNLTAPKEETFDLPVEYSELSQSQRRQVRQIYIGKQKGLCAYCEEKLSGPPLERIVKKWINEKLFPSGFFDHPVHLHHNHITDLTIGAVHARCNAYLWQYENE